MESLQSLPLDLVYPNPSQPRTIFDPEAIAELGESIRHNGLLQPIKVRADGTGRFMIVCGERRWRAHCAIGAPSIQALVVEMTDDELADAAIIENLQRRDITPLEEARAFQARLDAGLTPEELAERLGLKQAWRVTERTNLLKLADEYLDAFQKGLLTPSQCQEMSRLTRPFQRLLFEAIRDGRCRSYQELRAATLALLSAEKKGGQPSTFRLGQEREQVDLFSMPEPTPEEKRVVRRLERKIAAVEELLRGGIQDNEVVVCQRVDPGNVELMATKLELIERQLAKMRVALRTASVVARVA